MLHRLRSDYRLSIITLLGACAVVGITPFAIWRFLRGDILIGVLDLALLACIVSTVGYAWRTGDTLRSGLVLAFIICVSGVVIVSLIGDLGLFWLYPALISTFFLTLARVAIVANLCTVLLLIAVGSAFTSTEQMMAFAATAVVVSTCALAFALRTEQQRRRLEQLATLDPLTGVKNRRAMDEELNKAVNLYARNQTPYGLALLDLDHFKRVNDTYGHGVGDDMLLSLVHLLESNIRRTDQLFRYGGEEFLLLLPGVNKDSVLTVMRNIQNVLRTSLASPAGPVTASFGVAILNENENAMSWLSRADQALYQAKEAGRDRIILAD